MGDDVGVSAVDRDASSEDVQPLIPAMTPSELILLRATGGHRNILVEFGCGGSTAEWIQMSPQLILSVESDEQWVRKVREHPALLSAVETGRLDVQYADVGPTARWGRPKGRDHIELWASYWAGVWASPALSSSGGLADFVFVDGRFRVACALNAALRLKPGGLVAVHDFWARKNYYVVLEHLDVVATVDQLVVLSPKPDLDARAVVSDLAAHCLDFR